MPYINIGAWAIAGACLSIILRSGNLKNASYAGKRLHFIESGCRLIGGFITGQIIYLGIKSGILFSSLIGNSNSQYMIRLLALLAGASELICALNHYKDGLITSGFQIQSYCKDILRQRTKWLSFAISKKFR